MQLYVDEQQTLAQIAGPLNITEAAVSWHLRQAGISTRPPTGANLRNPATQKRARDNHPKGESHHSHRGLDDAALITMYEAGIGSEVIAARFDVSSMTVLRHLKAAGVVLREPGFSRWRRCTDGHLVQSGWELAVDEWLFERGIEHECQPALPFGRMLKADFLASGYYIEVWGVVHNRQYDERRTAKLEQYSAHGLPLIQVWPADIERRAFRPLHVLL